MNKKIVGIAGIIFLIIIIAIVGMSGGNNSSEIIMNNVSGVDNVVLSSADFETANRNNSNNLVTDTLDKWNNTIIINKATNDEIEFVGYYGTAMNRTYDPDTFEKEWINIEGDENVTKKTIAGIKGYGVKSDRLHDEFIFVVNDTVYIIQTEEGRLNQNIGGIEKLLTAWLEASNYNQSWDYPN